MLDSPYTYTESLLVTANYSTPENEGARSATSLKSVGMSLSSLVDLTPVLPLNAQRRCILALLC